MGYRSDEDRGPDLEQSGNPTAIYHAIELETDPAKIRQIAALDAAQLPRMRDHRDGWRKLAELGADVADFLDERITSRLDGNTAATVNALGTAASRTRDTAALCGAAADLNKHGFDAIIDTVDTFDASVNGIEGERGLLPGSKPGESTLADDADIRGGLDDELRLALKTANTGYQDAYRSFGYKPPTYDGPGAWTGPPPQTPPGSPTPPWSTTPRGWVPGRNPEVIVDDGPGFADNPDVIVDDGPGNGDVIVDDGPALQNPAAPPSAPPSTPVNPPPSPGGPPVNSPPVISNPPLGGGSRPLPPSFGTRPLPTPPPARATPGMGTPRSQPTIPGRTSGRNPVGAPRGQGAPTGSKASRALLPNQRAAAGRAATNPSHPGPRSTVTTPFGTSARTTVPPVIGARATGKPGTPTAAPQVRNAGKVIGERANKGKVAKKPIPKKLGGILRQQGFSRNSTPERPWSNAPKGRRTDNAFQGKVIGGRQEPVDAVEAAAAAALRRRQQDDNREALAKWRANRSALPKHELTDGLNSIVVPGVLSPTRSDEYIDRSDVGPVFGSGGWENVERGT